MRDYLNKNKNKLGGEIQTYISHKEALRPAQPRLTLNKTDNKFFQENVIPFENEIPSVKTRGLSRGEKNLLKTYQFFQKNLDSYSSKINNLLGNLLDNTYVIIIQVTDDIQAYTVFETLNARGQDLTAADLIKNSILAKASSKGILDKVLELWDSLSRNLSNYSITLFLKYYISMLHSEPIREKDLFKQIKNSGYIENDVANFASDLEKTAEVYLNILEPKSNYWDDKEIPKILNNISTMRLKTCYPLLLAISLSKHKTSVKKELFREVEQLGFRYSIISNKNPNELERKYSSWANQLQISKIEVHNLKDEMRKLKPSDKDFKEKFKTKTISDNKIAGYILREINTKMQEDALISIDDSATVEHILPVKPDKWIDYIKKNNDLKIAGEIYELPLFIEEITYRLGNQTLLLSEDNSKVGNESFDEKKKVFAKSKLKLNQELSSEKIWSLKEIEKYQEKMAEIALKIW